MTNDGVLLEARGAPLEGSGFTGRRCPPDLDEEGSTLSCLPSVRYSCSNLIEALPDLSRELAQPGIEGTGHISTESRRLEYIDAGPVVFLDRDDVQRMSVRRAGSITNACKSRNGQVTERMLHGASSMPREVRMRAEMSVSDTIARPAASSEERSCFTAFPKRV